MDWQHHRHAPRPGTALCGLGAVPDGGCKELRFGEGEAGLSLLLYRRGDEVRAYVNSCPHFSLPLNAHPDEFLLMDGERIMCAWHCAVFQLTSGRCLEGPANGMGLTSVPVHVAGNRVWVGSASAAEDTGT